MRESAELKRALELDRDGDWDGAHRIVQGIESAAAARIHAYLHRKEGDLGNAQYWYRRAGTVMPDWDLEREWNELYGEIGSATGGADRA
ncbi:MAG: hypothetical protein ACYC6Y_23970 [Thermoguttaceae bacterium]